MGLAAQLPFDHRFAGGFPGLSSQPLPTDADALDYLSRMATADGAGVETGVAVAVDAFFRDSKAAGVFSALKASCIMCGARTISGALVPLVGAAPTPYNFASGDYSRTTGLKGNGSSKYIDSNRSNDADGQDDQHAVVYLSALPVSSGLQFLLGAGGSETGATNFGLDISSPTEMFFRSRSVLAKTNTSPIAPGLCGVSRSNSDGFDSVHSGQRFANEQTSQTPLVKGIHVFRRNVGTGFETDARFAFYSIGSALDLAALDSRVTTLVSAIAAAI